MGELVSVAFTWRIDNFYTKLKTRKYYSEDFVIGDFKWRILVYPKGNNVDHLSLYLDVADSSILPSGWTRYAEFRLTVVNQVHRKDSVTKYTKHQFNAREDDWGFTSFMPLSELCDPGRGFIVNDVCIIEAEVSVRKVDIKIVEGQASVNSEPPELSEQDDQRQEPPNVDSEQVLVLQDAPSSAQVQTDVDSVQVPHSSIALTTPSSEEVLAFHDAPRSEQVCTEPTDIRVDPSKVKEHEEVPPNPVGKLVDFRGLGQIENAFVPLLDEVCSWHPSLIECQQKRSHMYTEWAFTALGRLLHFLKTTKVKDMTEDACKHLQLLWEELETFRFDLAWLEPRVQSALGMKKFVERAGQVKKMREDADALEIETKKLRAKLAVAEVDLEVAKRDLVKAEELFGETNMDGELGYGSR